MVLLRFSRCRLVRCTEDFFSLPCFSTIFAIDIHSCSEVLLISIGNPIFQHLPTVRAIFQPYSAQNFQSKSAENVSWRYVFNAPVRKNGWHLLQKPHGLSVVMRYRKPVFVIGYHAAAFIVFGGRGASAPIFVIHSIHALLTKKQR